MTLVAALPALTLAFGGLSTAPNITVHLVPHTHDDTGWLKTVDQYHSGSNNTIQHANVGRLISSVISSLSRNPERTFVYAEIAFFQRWWRVQSRATQALTRKLVAAGQLSFVNGGWCMHDEATPHYVQCPARPCPACPSAACPCAACPCPACPCAACPCPCSRAAR